MYRKVYYDIQNLMKDQRLQNCVSVLIGKFSHDATLQEVYNMLSDDIKKKEDEIQKHIKS